MNDSERMTRLARMLIVAAWADGQITPDERALLRELVLEAPELDEAARAGLERDLDRPPEPARVAELVEELAASMRDEAEKRAVVDAVERLLRADGMTRKERALLDRIEEAVADAPTTMAGKLGQALRGLFGVRQEVTAVQSRRFDEFVLGRAYAGAVRGMTEAGRPPIEPEAARLELLAAVSGLVAVVAGSDGAYSEAQADATRRALSERWMLSEADAELVARMAATLADREVDALMLGRRVLAATSQEERQRLVACLFAIANSRGGTSSEAMGRIQRISNVLQLAHREYVAAKLTIPGAERGGQ